MARYDADVPPDPEAWLALSEEEQTRRVRAHHKGRVLRIHPKDFNPAVHAALHAIVERQIAANDPPITGRTVERLVGEGLRRHAAVHAVGDVLLRAMVTGEPFDPAAYEAALGAIDASTWLGLRMRRDLG